jgi:hypothetical protein
MTISEILRAIQKETKIGQRELPDYLGVKQKEFYSWKSNAKSPSVPSVYQVRNILHFASLVGVDCSQFSWERYIESVLEIIYEDEYRIDGGIDEDCFRVHLCRRDGVDGYVLIEEITNKKKDLFKFKEN